MDHPAKMVWILTASAMAESPGWLAAHGQQALAHRGARPTCRRLSQLGTNERYWTLGGHFGQHIHVQLIQ